ncbi:MAG TPA: sigma-54 dependent transcriptional regulator [Deltaproteobacteria bacterium]|nr:sigma-54 dependent transcriptional regulator [Deltaproteobacteria bacterium]
MLIIEDEENLRHMLSVMLSRQGYSADTAENGAEGLRLALQQVYDFILCDIRMPEMDGKAFLEQALAGQVAAPVIMMSAYGSVDTAIECMKMGAYDFISKPFKKDEIVMVLKKAEERERLKCENSILREAVSGKESFCGIISRNPQMQEIFSLIAKVASLKTTVLILGESGTGKELVARAIHTSGNRAAKPFVAVNCGAIPENLLESELFGHVKGAFTDASSDKIGLFRQADGGTLFLDEVGEMPPSLQVKLLRVLQEEEVRPLGAQTSYRVNVRVVSATSRDLDADVREARFREDLYFRLNVFSMQLPPLRERIDDIPLLAGHFITRCAAGMGRSPARIAPDAMRRLVDYNWPGNVREMENMIERGLILCEGDTITQACLPDVVVKGTAPAALSGAAAEELSIKRAEAAMERDLIRKALARTGGNRTQAAKILEISHRSLLYKLKEYGIE